MSHINQPKMIKSFWTYSGSPAGDPVNACFMIQNRCLSRITKLMVAAVAIIAMPVFNAHAATSSWQDNEGGRMRLIALAPDKSGQIKAALQIEPKDGWITYWREPGESGVPPQITVAPDSGLALKKMGFPAPKPITIGDIREIGYDAPVTFPLDLAATGGSAPSKVDLTAFIGLCKDICIPFQASFSLPIPASGQSEAAEESLLEAADARLPAAPSPDFSIKDHKLSADGKTLSLALTLPEAAGDAPQIYVTGPSGYVFFKRANDQRQGSDFRTDIVIGKLPKTYNIHGKNWGILAIDGDRAIETTLAFD
jgi:DsbC/DsbD-like thiol-disulfide interchange protein